MNTSWMVLVNGRGSWMLMEVYTRRLIPLHSINTSLLWNRDPEYSESYSSQHDTKFDLLKVVICQVPTRSGNYKDFRLIAFFNRGLTYLTGHCGKWINLHVHCRIIHPPWFSDAIEHKGFHLRCRLLLWQDVLLAYSSHRYKWLLQQYVTFL